MSTPPIEWTPKARAVLEAATELFYDQGIAAVGVDAVAARAGVTKKTLYDRFGSKERLVVEYLRERDRVWREDVEAGLVEAGDDVEAQVLAVFDATTRHTARYSDRLTWKGCSMINAHAEISDPSHPAYEVIVGEKEWQRDLFRELVRRAGVAEPEELAADLMLLHEGALVVGGMGVDDHALERARATAVRLLRAALTPPAG